MTNSVIATSAAEKWFDNFIAQLRVFEVELETNTATQEVKNFFEKIFAGNADEIVHLGKIAAQQHFVARIILDYLAAIKSNRPVRLAFDFNDSEVLVWAEIADDHENMERQLLKAEAVINAKYHPYGFDMESTIVEVSDKLNIPNHYRVVN